MAFRINNLRLNERDNVVYDTNGKKNKVENIVFNGQKIWHKALVLGESQTHLIDADNPIGLPTKEYSIGSILTEVNLANGLFRTSHADISEGTGVNSLSISHIYNSYLNSDFVNKNIRTYMGIGFKLNVQQYLIKVNEDLYKYIDSKGVVHVIKRSEDVFYDTSGLGLLLSFAKDGSEKKYLKDRLGNQLIFNNEGYLIINKPTFGDKINLLYSDGKIVAVNREGECNYHFTLTYNDNNLLDKIISQNPNSNYIVCFEYDTLDRLKKVYKVNKYSEVENRTVVNYNYQTNSSKMLSIRDAQNQFLEFLLYHDGRLKEIQEGAIREGKKYIKNKHNISYISDCTTKVISNTITTIYNFDLNQNKILSVYEENTFASPAYSSIVPSPNIGTRIMDLGGQMDPTFNGSIVKKIVGEDKTYEIITNKETRILDKLKEENSIRKFTCSAWVKVKDLTSANNLELKFSTNNSSNIVKISTNDSIINKWQFLSCEMQFSKDEYIDYFKAEIINSKELSINLDVSDVRIMANNTNFYLENSSGDKCDIRDIISVEIGNLNYKVKDIREAKSTEMYLTSQDIESTLYNKHNNSSNFNFICNNGKRLIADCSTVIFETIDSKQFPLPTNTKDSPRYYLETVGQDDILYKNYIVYKRNNDQIFHYITAKRENIKTFEETIYSYNGLKKQQTDEYSVVTSFEYDSYGNVIKEIISSLENPASTNRIVREFKYGYTKQNIKEEVDERRNTTKYTYDEPQGSIKSIIEPKGLQKKEITWDSFGENIKDISVYTKEKGLFFQYSKNYFGYNNLNQLIGLSNDNIQYDLEYNCYGNISKQFINDNLIFEKEYKYSLGGEKEIGVTYGNASDIKNVDYFNKYGRHTIKIMNGIIKLKHMYSNQGLKNIETSEAKLRSTTDYYSGIIYEYKYDEEDNFIGYEQNYKNNSNCRLSIEVEQSHYHQKIFNYNYNNNLKTSTLVYDEEKFINPRVRMASLNGKNFTLYEYDDLGRIIVKNQKGMACHEYSYLPARENGSIVGTTNYVEKVKVKRDILTKDGEYDYEYIYDYDSNGNIKEHKIVYGANEFKYKRYLYQYDDLNRLKEETEILKLGAQQEEVVKKLEYQYDAFGNILEKKETSGSNLENLKTQTYSYNKNQLTKIDIKETNKNPIEKLFEYDVVGNPINYGGSKLTWERCSLLKSFKKDNIETSYTYGATGIRTSKTIDGKPRHFYLDGDKVIGETYIDIFGSIQAYIYRYDSGGLASMELAGSNLIYNIETDANGSVIAVKLEDKLLCQFSYDAYGNCTVEKVNDSNFNVNSMPFRWKGYYYDYESGFYYINGNYYDPTTGRYISPGSLEDTVNKILDNDLNLYSFANNNPLLLMSNIWNIEPSIHINPKNKAKKWYEYIGIFITGGLTIAAGVTAIVYGGGIVLGVAGILVGLGLFTIGIADILEATKGNNFIRNGMGWNQSQYNKLKNNLYTSATILQIAITIHNIQNSLEPRIAQCFKKGTIVKTSSGDKTIEDIEVGDLVYAYDEKTKTKDLKKVVRLFRNGKEYTNAEIHTDEGVKEWINIRVTKENCNEESELITCTFEHPFYVFNTTSDRLEVCFEGIRCTSKVGEGKWISAKDLKTGDKLLLFNGENAIISSVKVEHNDESQTTYNFEVEDFHTYYVGKEGILVHNACPGGLADDVANSADDAIQTGGTKDFSIHESRRSAYRAARRDAGVLNQRPTSVTDAFNKQGKWIPGKHYNFGDKQILWHSAGHPEYGMTRHFNYNGWHYFY